MMKNEELKKSVSPCNEMIKSKATLSEVCEFIVDCPHSTAIDEGVGYPLIRTPNVGKGRLILTDVHRVSEDVYNLRNARAIPQEDDLIFAREAPAGNVAQIRKGEKVCLGQRTVLLRPNKQFVDSSFLTYYLLAPKQQYRLTGSANGATVAHINLPAIRNFVIEIPDIITQKILGEILSAYDNLIENNNKRIKILEQMAENLYKEWFVRFRFPGHEASPIENGIPHGWKRDCINKFYTTSSGGTPSREKQDFYEDGTIPWVKTGEIVDSIIQKTEEKITEEAVKKSSAKMIPSGSLLMAMYGVNIGKLGITSIEMTCNQAACVFKDLGAKSSAHYLFHYLKSIREYLLSISFGAAQQNLSQELIKKIKVVMPSKTILEKFEDFVSSYYDEISALQNQNDNLIKQRDLLLPRLMSGKLAV